MDKERIFEMVIREMTENALSSRRENLEEGEQQLYTEVGTLSSQARDIVKGLPEEKQKILIDYFEKTNLIALEKVNNATFSINYNAVYMVPYGIEKLKLIDENFKALCNVTNHSSYTISYPTSGTIPEELEALLPKTDDKSMWEWMTELAVKCDSIEELRNRGIVDSLVIIHDRILTREASTALTMNGCCTPGARRLYIDTKGDLYACERINKSPKLGNILKGIDFDSIFSKYFREYSDKSFEYCANCWAAKICPFCYANRMTTEGISKRAHIHCEQMKLHVKRQFSLYHEILETNPERLSLLKDVIVK